MVTFSLDTPLGQCYDAATMNEMSQVRLSRFFFFSNTVHAARVAGVALV